MITSYIKHDLQTNYIYQNGKPLVVVSTREYLELYGGSYRDFPYFIQTWEHTDKVYIVYESVLALWYRYYTKNYERIFLKEDYPELLI